MTRRRHILTGGLLLATLLGSACSSTASAGHATSSTTTRTTTTRTTTTRTTTTRTTTAAAAIPGAQWQAVAPAAVGLDATKLAQIAHTAEAGKSNCLAIVRDGKLAGQWYFHGTSPTDSQDIFSATKSIASTLVGVAADDGDLKISDRASKWIPQWRGTPSETVTIRDILSGGSGRQWSPAIDYGQLLRASDRTAFAIGLKQQEPPGQVWAYNNSADQTLEAILRAATGEAVTTFAEQRLFIPLGMTHTRMTTDRAGNAQLFEGVHSTCQDMARFGTMLLDHGRWGNRQIVSSAWVSAATGPSSTKLNAAYGYLFWLNHEGTIGSPLVATNLAAALEPTTMKGRIVPGAPDDMFWALGLGNQLVQVDPGSGTVVVRLGSAERPKPPTFGPAEASAVVTEAVVAK